mgnify:FL=1
MDIRVTHMKLVRLLYHFIVPRESNNHRAKALHHDALFAYALLFMVFNLGLRVVHDTVPDVLGYATDIRVEQLLEDTNAKRKEAGLSQLVLSSSLSQAALDKADDMFANNYWAHNSPAGKTPWDFIVRSGYSYTIAGENLAKNFQTSSGVTEAWMNSQTHKDNIIKPGYREVGFAVVNGTLLGEETTLVVQMFGTSSGQVTAIRHVEAAENVVKPVDVIPAESSLGVSAGTSDSLPVLSSVRQTPLINIKILSREVAFIFIGLLIGIMAIDAYVVSRRGVVRLVGHNVAHIVFLASMLAGSMFMLRGSLG